MKKLTKFFALTLLIALSIGLIPANASATAPNADNIRIANQPYQQVLERLNKEYGTNVHFATSAQEARYNTRVEAVDVSVAEFEKYMHEMIEANQAANDEAIAKSARLISEKASASGSGICRKVQ